MFFTCAGCRGTFVSSWTNEDAVKEFENHFGRKPNPDEIAAVVCRDCYKKIMEFNEGPVQ